MDCHLGCLNGVNQGSYQNKVDKNNERTTWPVVHGYYAGPPNRPLN